MSGNQELRVNNSLDIVSGPLIGENLLPELKKQMIAQSVFKVMFGENGERIFIDKYPNINESILPAIFFAWKSETFRSFDVYFEGTISAIIALPVMLEGDANALRRVGLLFQRFMGGQLNLFDSVLGLIRFGYGQEYNYEGLAKFDGFSAPAIQITIPFQFDLSRLQLQLPEFDPYAPLDDADVGWIEQFVIGVDNVLDNTAFNSAGVDLTTGETNV